MFIHEHWYHRGNTVNTEKHWLFLVENMNSCKTLPEGYLREDICIWIIKG